MNHIKDIAEVLPEIVRPGDTGILEQDENGPTGDLMAVAALAKWCGVHAGDLLKHAQAGDVRQARLALIELEGAFSAARQEIDAAAEQQGLPPLGGK